MRSDKSLRLTKMIIVDRINLKYSPFRTLVNFAPIWTPKTEPNKSIVASTISTVWFCEAWSIVVLAATKIIWNKEVPTTNDVGIPKR